MNRRVVLVGGTGFIGAATANRLTAAALDLLVPTRQARTASPLALLPTVDLIPADVHDPATLLRLFAGAEAVVNLVGILHSRSGSPYGADFAKAHVELPRKIVAAAAQAGVRRLVHISALGASADGPSEYLRSKAAGEEAVRAAPPGLSWTILRPSVVFGRNDRFLNLFAQLARRFPLLPLAGAQARFQPVYVEDVAEVIWRCLSEDQVDGQTYEVAGPTVYTLRELVEYVSRLVDAPRPVIPLPDGLAMAQAALMELAPQPLMSRDNVRSMKVDNVASGDPLPFGLAPRSLEALAPAWLAGGNSRGHYDRYRRGLRHNRG